MTDVTNACENSGRNAGPDSQIAPTLSGIALAATHEQKYNALFGLLEKHTNTILQCLNHNFNIVKISTQSCLVMYCCALKWSHLSLFSRSCFVL